MQETKWNCYYYFLVDVRVRVRRDYDHRGHDRDTLPCTTMIVITTAMIMIILDAAITLLLRDRYYYYYLYNLYRAEVQFEDWKMPKTVVQL